VRISLRTVKKRKKVHLLVNQEMHYIGTCVMNKAGRLLSHQGSGPAASEGECACSKGFWAVTGISMERGAVDSRRIVSVTQLAVALILACAAEYKKRLFKLRLRIRKDVDRNPALWLKNTARKMDFGCVNAGRIGCTLDSRRAIQ
jgi:hypothetical protein